MTKKQLRALKPGDRVRGKYGVVTVTGVVVYITKDSQTVDAVKIGNVLYQREEMLQCFQVTRQGARRRG